MTHTTNPNAYPMFRDITAIERDYRRNRILQGLRNVEALADIYVFAILGYEDLEEGAWSIAINVVAYANSYKDDDYIAVAYAAVEAIILGCNYAILMAEAFDYMGAIAFAHVNLDCFPDCTSPFSCLTADFDDCGWEVAQADRCGEDGLEYNPTTDQLYLNGEVYCHCHTERAVPDCEGV